MATKLSLKLLIDSRTRKVLFAEASKGVVDFLFSLLTMPVGSIIKLLNLNKEKMEGAMGSIYTSVESLDETYMQSSDCKSMLLNPTTGTKNALFLIEGGSETTEKEYYRCLYNNGYSDSSCKNNYTDFHGTRCPSCRNQMTKKMHYVAPKSCAAAASASAATGESTGFVKGVVTYTVMDDLTVMPMSAISSITLLNKCNVKNLGSLEERTVNLGMKEGLELLRVSFQSKTVLTDVFMGRKKTRSL